MIAQRSSPCNLVSNQRQGTYLELVGSNSKAETLDRAVHDVLPKLSLSRITLFRATSPTNTVSKVFRFELQTWPRSFQKGNQLDLMVKVDLRHPKRVCIRQQDYIKALSPYPQ
jgi:hypothetical protein